MSELGRVIVAGRIAASPGQGGAAWAVLQWVLGLQALGHDVWFLERIPEERLTPPGASVEHSENARYFRSVMATFGLADRSALFLSGSDDTVGLPRTRLEEVAGDTGLLIDLSGVVSRDPLTEKIPLRLYVDMDPGFTQLWHAVLGADVGLVGHTHFATYGQSIGSDGTPIPDCGVEWIPTLPPVVLESWPLAGAIRRDAFTTVANWRSYGSIEHEGQFFGQKAHSFRSLALLPTLTPTRLILALSIHPDEQPDIELLQRHGWAVEDAARVVSSPRDYQRFIQGSKGELGVAKSGYVVQPTGWFSDRSACYLASGRPVVAQDTGFAGFLPTGVGLLSFSSAEEAAQAIERVNTDYDRHSRAARELAEAHLDSAKVLTNLLRAIGAIA